MSSATPEPGDGGAPPSPPWYRLPMLAAAVYCAVMLAIILAVLLLPLR